MEIGEADNLSLLMNPVDASRDFSRGNKILFTAGTIAGTVMVISMQIFQGIINAKIVECAEQYGCMKSIEVSHYVNSHLAVPILVSVLTLAGGSVILGSIWKKLF